MATSPSSPDRGAPSAEEVAAVIAAVEIVLRSEAPAQEPAVPVWRWSGRRWQWPEAE